MLRDEGHEVSVRGNGRDALRSLRVHRPDVKKPFRLEQLLDAVARVSGVAGRA